MVMRYVDQRRNDALAEQLWLLQLAVFIGLPAFTQSPCRSFGHHMIVSSDEADQTVVDIRSGLMVIAGCDLRGAAQHGAVLIDQRSSEGSAERFVAEGSASIRGPESGFSDHSVNRAQGFGNQAPVVVGPAMASGNDIKTSGRPRRHAVTLGPERTCSRGNLSAMRTRMRVGWFIGPLVFIGVFVAAVYPFPYVSFSPGTALDVNDRIDVIKGPNDETKDQVLLVTVGVKRKLVLAELVIGWLKDDVDIQSEKEVFGTESATQSQTRSRAEMDTAKVTAQLVALRKLGERPTGGAAKIEAIGAEFPAAKVLKEGDLILEVDGQTVCLQGDVRTALSTKREGDTVSIRIERNGKVSDVVAPLRWIPENKRAFLGVELSREKACPLPIEVEIATTVGGQDIGGPSAGLAMTVALLDRLTPGDLTGGKKVAITGTIEADGSVGEIGGIKQKTFAVKRAGATMFIVPKAEVKDAEPYAGNMKVVGVTTLDEALSALRAAGGAALPQALA